VRCRYCLFLATPECRCNRCPVVLATGFCNLQHRAYFKEELELEKRKTLDKAANN
jgi:hypothetical protein